jgi:hypothetical protein
MAPVSFFKSIFSPILRTDIGGSLNLYTLDPRGGFPHILLLIAG